MGDYDVGTDQGGNGKRMRAVAATATPATSTAHDERNVDYKRSSVLMIVGGSDGDGDGLWSNRDVGCDDDADDTVAACNNDAVYCYQAST